MDIKTSENEENGNLTYINNEFTPRMQQTKLDTADFTSTSNLCARMTPSENKCFEHESKDGVKCYIESRCDDGRKDSGCCSIVGGQSVSGLDRKDKTSTLYKIEKKSNSNSKNKRKRRRGKQKSKSKPFKKENWKFQMPQRYRSNSNSNNLANMSNVLRKQIQRQRSIVPYNTNKFLMEEHLAEVPNALLTTNGRTRDSSFSIDSEDNYFFSLPEDEEDFLTKEFSNVYERARVERLEGMNKQQLIEECLQMEDRCSQIDSKQHQKYCEEFMTRIKYLEEKVQRLSRENNEMRRVLENSNLSVSTKLSHKINKIENRMCSSEDSESDSSSNSNCSSSCSTSSISEYSSQCSPRNHKTCEKHTKNESQTMETDDNIKFKKQTKHLCHHANQQSEMQQNVDMKTEQSLQTNSEPKINSNDEDSQSLQKVTNDVNCKTNEIEKQ